MTKFSNKRIIKNIRSLSSIRSSAKDKLTNTPVPLTLYQVKLDYVPGCGVEVCR